MTSISTGDLARSLMLRRQTAELKTALLRHGQELTTGRAADPARALRGDVAALAALERGRTALAAHGTAAAETALHAAGQQGALAKLSEEASTLSRQLVGLGPGVPPQVADAIAGMARAGFDSAIGALNTRVADRSLFAGAATDRAALAPADDILAALRVDLAGLTDPAELEAAVADWFAPGGGFEAVALTGSPEPAGPIAVAPGESVSLDVTAARAELRPLLAGLALAALVADGPPGADNQQRIETLQRAGSRLGAAQSGLIALAGALGATEARIATAQTRNAAEATALDIARDDLIGVDPFEAATRLEDTRTRIETLFALTARLQRLSLTEFLR